MKTGQQGGENRGGKFCHDLEDWFRAESELLHPVRVDVQESDDALIGLRGGAGIRGRLTVRLDFLWRFRTQSELLSFTAVSVGLLMVSGPMLAHHGTAAYDTTKSVTVQGTVTEFQFVNPHVEIYFDVKGDKGNVEKWQAEATSPNHLARAGWTKNTLKPGDQITATG